MELFELSDESSMELFDQESLAEGSPRASARNQTSDPDRKSEKRQATPSPPTPRWKRVRFDTLPPVFYTPPPSHAAPAAVVSRTPRTTTHAPLPAPSLYPTGPPGKPSWRYSLGQYRFVQK